MKKIVSLLVTLALCVSLGAVCAEGAYPAGVTVVADAASPTGYTATFVLEKFRDDIAAVALTGPFNYLDPAMDVLDPANDFAPQDYKNGMYPSNMVPGRMAEGGMGAAFGCNIPMAYDEAVNAYVVSIPISSGSFNYGYNVTYADETSEKIADPANPSPALVNPNSNITTGDVTSSIAYGQWDAEKQSESPSFDYVRPVENGGTVTYVEYTGVLGDDQDLGIYVPADYDPERAEPYKTVYASHGGGGSEVDWFAMGHVDNIVDNLGLDVIVVTMDNNSLGWDYPVIEDNVLNYIIPYIEANYNVSKEAKDRAFCGLSMGSMTTFNMFFDHPEAFGYYGAFSGPDMNAIQPDKEGIDQPTFYFTVGTCDIASGKILPNDDETKKKKYEDFVEYLAEHPMDNVIDGGYVPGAHDWFTWSYSIKTFMTDICWK